MRKSGYDDSIPTRRLKFALNTVKLSKKRGSSEAFERLQLQKVISGGQTGVDRAALDAAYDAGYLTGGWCPPGHCSDDGQIPEKFNLVETVKEHSKHAPNVARSLRTELNVRDADATLILCPDIFIIDDGTSVTLQFANKYKKNWLRENPFLKHTVHVIAEWLIKHNVKVLNVAGPSENNCPGIYNASFKTLSRVFKKQFHCLD